MQGVGDSPLLLQHPLLDAMAVSTLGTSAAFHLTPFWALSQHSWPMGEHPFPMAPPA